MALIFYGLSGDGRGHATRVRTVVEQLRTNHRIVIYAPHDAYDFLSPLYVKSDEVSVRSIPGLRFCYTEQGTADYLRTGLRTIDYVRGLPALLSQVRADIEREQPDLIISDFDPALPWAAQGSGIPIVSLDHQHVMATSDLRHFPAPLRAYAAWVSPAVRAFSFNSSATIVSSFAFPPPRLNDKTVHRVGVLLRDEVLKARPESGCHVVAYFRRSAPSGALEALAAGPRPVKVYGLGEQPPSGVLQFKGVHPRRFIEDLATSCALVSTAGNQLVGEALYLVSRYSRFPKTATTSSRSTPSSWR